MMKLRGSIWKSKDFWIVECPSLKASTQGRTRADGLAMMKDWVQTILDDEGLEFDIELDGDDEFVMTFNDPKPILDLIEERSK